LGWPGFRFWRRIEQRRRNLELLFVVGPLYGDKICLVTSSRKERPPATHGFVLSTMRKKGDEDELLVIFWTKRYLGPDWAVLG
jgi:hypothetical protein